MLVETTTSDAEMRDLIPVSQRQEARYSGEKPRGILYLGGKAVG